jgi:outer membrane protein with beta-barrel domain
VKRIFRYLPLLLASASCVPYAAAQSTFDFNMGFGAAQDKAPTSGLDVNPVSGIFFACQNATDPTCVNTKSLSGFMLGFGGNLMLWKHFGVGANVSFQVPQQTYATFQQQVVSTQTPGIAVKTRMTLYDFDAIYQPVKEKKVALQLLGGIGGANLKFYEAESSTDALAGSSNISQYFESANHFQVHGGVGVQFYLTDHFYLRPQFDVNYVNNLTQFGSKMVTQEMVWVGYSFGGQ